MRKCACGKAAFAWIAVSMLYETVCPSEEYDICLDCLGQILQHVSSRGNSQ